MRARLKTPISYYGGKQKLVSTILPLIPAHRLYTEAFVGGGAIFWAKDPSPVEVVNDANGEIVNFYRVLQSRFPELQQMVEETLHSRELHRDAGVIYTYPHLFSEVQRAWAVWIQTNMSFSSKILSGWAYCRKKDTCEKSTRNKIDAFREAYRDRLLRVQVENNDALQVIKSRDCADAFHYQDPPYPGTCLGHYKGYTMAHFLELLEGNTTLEGKFLLSSFPYPELTEYAQRHGWHQKEIVQNTLAAGGTRTDKKKVEVLTANYAI